MQSPMNKTLDGVVIPVTSNTFLRSRLQRYYNVKNDGQQNYVTAQLRAPDEDDKKNWKNWRLFFLPHHWARFLNLVGCVTRGMSFAGEKKDLLPKFPRYLSAKEVPFGRLFKSARPYQVITAPIIMHVPGLYCRFMFESPQGIVLALLGSVCEGTLILFLLEKLVRPLMNVRCSSSFSSSSSVATTHVYWHNAVRIALHLVAVLLLLGTIVACILGDYVFQQKTGGETPDIWVIAMFFHEAASQINMVLSDDKKSAILEVIVVLVSVVASMIIYACSYPKNNRKELIEHQPRAQEHFRWGHNSHVYLTVLTAVMLYAAGAWMPVIHAYSSLVGSCILVPEGEELALPLKISDRENTIQYQGAELHHPNVILIVHESLSGPLVLDTQSGKEATPFFHKMMDENDDFYVFKFTTSASGDTVDAFTSIVSGCLPFTDTGRKFALGQTIGTEFKRNGYRTASFSATCVKCLKGTKWFMLHNIMSANFDHVVSPDETSSPKVNGDGQDDRLLVPHFKKWIEQLPSNASFFAQFYLFNTHYPFLRDKNSSATERIFGSFETADETIKRIFHVLNETDQLNNTIIIGTGDHGELAEKHGSYRRTRYLNGHILRVLSYIHMPRKFFMSEEQRETLIHNTDQVTSILDLFPTMRHWISRKTPSKKFGTRRDNDEAISSSQAATGYNMNAITMDHHHCLGGVDLVGVRIPTNRVVIGCNSLSMRKERWLGAISTKTEALYHRHGWEKKNGLSVIQYKTNYQKDPMQTFQNDLGEEDRVKWGKIMDELHNNADTKDFMSTGWMKQMRKELTTRK